MQRSDADELGESGVTIYIAKDNFSAFSARWDHVAVGARSLNHNGIMAMIAKEASCFGQMAKDGRAAMTSADGRWTYSIEAKP